MAGHDSERSGTVHGEDCQGLAPWAGLEIPRDKVLEFKYRIVVAGSRSYNNFEEFAYMLERLLHERGYEKANSVIISGDAWAGPDAMAIRFAIMHWWKFSKFTADWERHGRGAGYIRNAEMKKVATDVYVFWDLVSRGSRNMLDISKKDKSIYTHLVAVHPDFTPYTR